MSEPTPAAQAMDRLLEIMARLRAPDGCAWDREQTPATLKPQMLEECYEVIEAIDSGSPGHLTEELGDLLLHIVFQAQIAREEGDFTFADVANGIADKLIRRHPHVFGDAKATDAAAVVAQWNELKKVEKPERESALDGVPRALPALMRAEALQKKARNVGFAWPDARGHVGEGKVTRFARDLRLEDDVQEQVAELLGEMLARTGIDRLEHLVAFLEHLRLQHGGGLFAVPRTAAGRAQPGHQVDDFFDGRTVRVVHGTRISWMRRGSFVPRL